jgi:uncharacterized protein (DUF1800 family)
MPDDLRPLREHEFDYRKAQHLLSRAGFGGTPGQVRAFANLGLEKAVAHVVDFEAQTYDAVRADAFDADIMRPPGEDERRAIQMARRSGDEAAVERARRERQDRERRDRQQMREIQRWWLTRMIESPRPLEEKLTLFWHGHFATGYRTIEDSYHMFMQNQLFRSRGAGRFDALVHAIVRDPAMLEYLDNDQNRRQRPNENFARELMELFTLGEGNGYTEDDIKEGARALTGNAFDDDRFVFRDRQHDDGPKRIFGRTDRFDGASFVDLLFAERGRVISEFICLKLYRFFVNDLPAGPSEPAKEFLRALAARFRQKDWSVKEVLRTLFLSAHFYDEANVAARIKSPVELLVQTVRTLRTPVRSLDALLGAADLMGQNIGYPPSVKGWDGGRSWINTSTLFVRQNVVAYLLTGRRVDGYPWEADGAPYDATHLVADLVQDGGAADAAAVATYLLRTTLAGAPHPTRVDELARYFAAQGGRLDNDVLLGALALVAAMPEYQLC